MPPGGAAAKAGGKKLVKWLPVGKLFRAADGKTGVLIRDASKLGGDAAGTAGRKVAQKQAWRQARNERNKLLKAIKADKAKAKQLLKQADEAKALGRRAEAKRLRTEAAQLRNQARNKAKTVTGATDPETGITKAGYSHKPTPPEKWGCAEKNAADEINAARERMGLPRKDPKDFDYSDAVDVKTGTHKPICTTCQGKIPPDRFPNGTEYYTDPRFSPPSPWE